MYRLTEMSEGAGGEKWGESMYKGKGVTGPLTIYVFIMRDLKREKSDNQFINRDNYNIK